MMTHPSALFPGLEITCKRLCVADMHLGNVLLHICIRVMLYCRYAFAFFSTEDAAKAAHDGCKATKMEGHALTVLYARKSAHKPGEKRKPAPTKEGLLTTL